MLWGTWIIAVVTVLYAVTAIAYVLQRQYGSALIFSAYSLANIGFFWQTGVFKWQVTNFRNSAVRVMYLGNNISVRKNLMNDLNRIELAIRRAASQMPNFQSRAFRLLADEISYITGTKDEDVTKTLSCYKILQRDIDWNRSLPLKPFRGLVLHALSAVLSFGEYTAALEKGNV